MSEIATDRSRRKKLTRLRIDEIASVSEGAGIGVQVKLVKRNEENPMSVLTPQQYVAKHGAHALVKRVIEQKGAEFLDADDVLKALGHRASEEQTNSSKVEKYLQKKRGAVKLAKHIVEQGSDDITEEQFVEAIRRHAMADQQPGETEAGAFARVYGGATEEATLLRKAHAVIKGFPVQDLTPTQVGGKDVNVDAPTSAVAQMRNMAAKMRKKSPGMTFAQAFAVIAADTRNAEILAAAIFEEQQSLDTTQRGPTQIG
jgi:hypothetical protein